ncbi:MAG: GH3 auxin-responsive promoter family protein [bacterium]|nr:GH3 auxin-responsive promoter family protein [bacterium]
MTTAFDITPALKLFAKFRLAQLAYQSSTRKSLMRTQERELRKLLIRAFDTKFGRDHDFIKITSVAEYQKRVPIRKYEEMWESYWKSAFPNLVNCSWPGKVNYFALSSGTTSGSTKYIPYTKEIMKTTTRAGVDLLVHHVNNRPKSKLLGGKSFILSGSTDLVQFSNDVIGGDMSGICMKLMPAWARNRSYPPKDNTGIKSWETMIDKFAESSLSADIRSLNGAPSWMLLFLDKLRQIKPESSGKLANLYPNLEMVVHGGMSFAPYKKIYDEILEGSRAETREVYPASEGFLAVQDRGYSEGMRLIIDNGIFFEFIPTSEMESSNPTRHWIGNVEADLDYAVVLTTQAGLWSYFIGDIVRFVSVTPPRILMPGRTSYMLSAVGEHVIGEEIDDSLLFAANEAGLNISEYSVGAIFPKNSSELVGHQYVIEFGSKIPSTEILAKFIKTYDQKLIDRNEDYAAHRKNEFGLSPPKFLIANSGAFKEWMRSRGKLGGQNKVPRVINNQELFWGLFSFVENYNQLKK